MKKILLMSFILINHVFANEKGNGGDAVVCFKDIQIKDSVLKILKDNRGSAEDEDPFLNPLFLQNISKVELLDFYLAKLNPQYKLDETNINSLDDGIAYYLTKLGRKSSFVVDIHKARSIIKEDAWYSSNNSILPINDS